MTIAVCQKNKPQHWKKNSYLVFRFFAVFKSTNQQNVIQTKYIS